MRRYGEDGPEEGFFQDEDGDEGVPQEVGAIIEMQTNMVEAMELDLVEQNLNQELLHTAIRLAKQDWLWWFRPHSKKLRRIERIYRRLTVLVRESLEKEED